MIKKNLTLFFFFLITACGNFEFVLKDNYLENQLKNKVSIFFEGYKNKIFSEELYFFLGNNKDGEFILVTQFSEKKENRLIKKNQVAEKIDYKLTADYELYYKSRNCKVYEKQIVSKFSFVPKSFGYNFGTERSLEKLYKVSVKRNIQNFINSSPSNTACIE